MRKFLLIAVLALLSSATVSAKKWGFGPKVGATFANVNGLEGSQMQGGVVAGAFAVRDLKHGFAIQTELLWSQQGCRQTLSGGIYETRLSYLTMPLLTKYYLVRGLNVELGAQFGYLVTAKITGDEGYSLKNAINKYNVDMLIGLGYDFRCGLTVEGRYNIGLTNLQRVNVTQDLRNATMQVMVGWRF